MKVNVTIAGASYSEVPSILIPLKNGGRARFCEVSDTTAKAADVAKGKKFYTSEGELVTGTADLSQADARKTITLIQKEHQTITLTCNHPELSSQTDSDGNTVYATTYQDTLSINLMILQRRAHPLKKRLASSKKAGRKRWWASSLPVMRPWRPFPIWTDGKEFKLIGSLSSRYAFTHFALELDFFKTGPFR